MLRIAIQTKGRLNEDTMSLLSETGIKLESAKRLLLLPAKNFPVEVLFLRDDDIPQSVADGVAALAPTGRRPTSSGARISSAQLGISPTISVAAPMASHPARQPPHAMAAYPISGIRISPTIWASVTMEVATARRATNHVLTAP